MNKVQQIWDDVLGCLNGTKSIWVSVCVTVLAVIMFSSCYLSDLQGLVRDIPNF